MKVGMFLPQVGEYATKENILYVAREAEKEGIDSVWVLDRLLWPPESTDAVCGQS